MATPKNNETPAQTIARLIAENAALKAKVAEADAADAARAEIEKDIAARTAKGLTRDQAIKAIQTQKDHDAAVAAEWAQRRPGLVAILKLTGLTEREQRQAIRDINPAIGVDEINAAKATI